MPLNPDAVGATSEPAEFSWTSKDALLYAVSIGAGEDELAFTTENTAGVDQVVFPTFPVVMGYGAGARRDVQHRDVQPGDARPRPAGGDAAPADPARGHGDADVAADRHVRQGQGGRRRHRQRRDDGRRAALLDAHVGVHPRRGRLGRRSRPVRPAERAAGPRAGQDRDVPDVAGPGVPLPAQRRPQPAAHRPRRSPPPAGSTSRSCTACAATASPAAASCTCCATPTRRTFHHIEGRFASPVLPGEALTIKAWETAPGEAVFTTSVGDRVVIDQGLLKYG